MNKSLLVSAVVSCLAAVSVWGADKPTKALDPVNFDTSVKPQDDFYQFANGGWIKANPIPPEYSSWGVFNEIDEHNKVGLKKILERVSSAKNGSGVEKLVGDFYATGMDTAAIDAAGIAPLKPELERIEAIKSADDLPAAIAHLHVVGAGAAFAFGSEPDPKDSSMVIGSNGQGGLGLPERDYYLRTDEKSAKLREQYMAHVATLLEMSGLSADSAKSGAASVMKLETALAQGSKTNVELRDPVANYHKMPMADLQKLTPHFSWTAYFSGLGLAKPGDIDVSQPEFLKALDAEMTQTSLDVWKTYLRWHLVHHAAAYMSEPFVDANFAFYGKVLTGREKLRERWKRVLDTTDGSIGEALGQLYVADYFPPESKTYMLKLVGNLQAALRERLKSLAWMDEPTRAAALKKLQALNVKIGYPDKWIDYSTLKLDRSSYVLNVFRAAEFASKRDIAKIGKPVDRMEWGMTPPAVNAYYNPQLNEIVFPAGILQSPFFDAKSDDATNYGGIGAIIGHEMTHGFDDQGRQFDDIGNLTDWWTAESAERFSQRSKAIVKQFSEYIAVDDLHINGELTQGENIADLGGVKISYSALQKALKEKPEPEKIDGFTPIQRFFLAYATNWRSVERPETLRLQVQTDPHSPAKFRVIGPLSNLPEFADAFHFPETAPIMRPASERVEIW